MTAPAEIEGCTGALIAGGRAVRLGGVPKGLLRAAGEPIAARSLRLFRELFGAALVVANDPAPYAALGAPVVADLVRGKGAPGGLHAALPLGDALDLSGSAPGADTVYLFLTGPNLPSNGVRLDNIAVEVITGVQSTFVRVPVFGDDSWEYSWNTRTAGGVLDAGTHTVYIVTTPTGRRDLSGRDSYGVISVTLTRPTLPILPSGGLTITSEPAGAGVLVDGEIKGTTPLELTNVSSGNHTVEIIKDGFEPVSEDIAIQNNETISMGLTLEPMPTGAASVPETSAQPTSIGFPVAGLFLTLGIAFTYRRFK